MLEAGGAEERAVFAARTGRRRAPRPRLGKKAAQAIPGAKRVELAGVGHLPQVEALDRYFAALAGFLGEAAEEKPQP